MRVKTAGEMAVTLSELLHEKLGVRGAGLEDRLDRAGRRLPARIRRQARAIAEAAGREANPRLARQNDPAALARAFAEVEAHLKKIDATGRRVGAALGVLASASFGLLAVSAGLVTYLRWRGFL